MDMEMLQAIGKMMDAKLDVIREEIQQMKVDIVKESTHNMKLLLDTEVTTKFNLLAEGIEDILRRMPNEDDMDIIDGRLTDLEADVTLLKKAN